MRERGILFALLAGMGAVTYHSVSSSGTGPQQVSGTESVTGPLHSAEENLAKTFDAFDKRRRFTIKLTPDGAKLGAKKIAWLQEPVATSSFNWMPDTFDWAIATVPDPEHSNLKLDFDREIEFLQLAAAGAGYQFERYWLPWNTEAQLQKESSYLMRSASANSGSKNDGFLIGRIQDNRASLPGVLLFRNKGSYPLALFLVSESPTGGIAAEEFRTAVTLGRQLSELGRRKDDRVLRLIGPGMSGSLASLSTLINTQRPPFQEIEVRTWTQDHVSHKQFRESVEDADWAREHERSCGGQDWHFKPMQVDSVPAIQHLIRYIRETWQDRSPIVLLTEEATAFGHIQKSDIDKETDILPECTCLGRQVNAGKDKRDDHLESVWTIPFPRNLSQLRNASEKQDHVPGFGDDSHRSDLPRTGILMSLKQETEAALEIPAFSKEQTPVSQESVLFTIGGLLKTGAVHYVGILATDPLDTLFLARYLRKASPNVRVFTLNADLLLEHGSDSSDYSGILTISSFPLIPLSQVWTGSYDSVYAFPTSVSEAVYNSTLDVLSHVPGSNLARSGLDRPLRDRVDPFSNLPNSSWVTVAGRSGFEPVAILSDKEGPPAASTGDRRFPPEYWPGWGYAFIAMLVLCIAFCGLMLFARPDGKRSVALFSAQPDAYPSTKNHATDSYDPAPRAFYLFSIGIGLSLLTLSWLVVPAIIVQWNVNSELHRLERAGGLLLPVGVLVLLGLRLGVGAPLAVEKKRRRFVLLPTSNAAESASVLGSVGFLLIGVITDLLSCPITNSPTYVLPHLWFLFCLGSFCVGATLAASTLPFWNIFGARARRKKNGEPSLVDRGKLFPYLLAAVPITSIFGVLAALSIRTMESGSPVHFLAAYRSLDLTNGVSPLVPITLLFVAAIVLAFVQLRRIAYYDDHLPAVPELKDDEFCPKLDTIVGEVRDKIRKLEFHPAYAVALVLFLVLVWCVITGAAQTLETRPLEVAMMGAVIGVGSFIVLIWIRLMLVWSAFSEFLQQLERHPLRKVFSLLPRGFIWSPVWQGGGKKRTHVTFTRSVECMQAILNHPRSPQALKNDIQNQCKISDVDSLVANTKELLKVSAMRRRFSPQLYQKLEGALKKVAERAVEYLRRTKWERGDYELKAELASKEETKDALHTPRPEYLKEEPATICGELVAFRFLAFINFVLWHIDNLVTYVSVGFLLLVIALSSYAFRARTIIDWMLILLFAVLTAGIVIVFAQADRDAILSRISGTEEGKLDRHFFTHLISYGGIPALVLLSTHFPTIGRFFFSWVKPALEAIH